MSPEQFRGHSSPLVAPETITDASVDAVNSTRKCASSDADETSPPAKRGRGRPRKTANTDVPAKPKAKTKTKAAKKDKSNEENLPPAIDIVDSDDELEKNEEGKPRYWTAEEKARVFEFFLGPDADAERHFNQHKVNPGHVYKRVSHFCCTLTYGPTPFKASELFDGARSADSIKS
jgi:hypothetical protein